ncbi:RDD family protein [Monashia sp. NPDC004114]
MQTPSPTPPHDATALLIVPKGLRSVQGHRAGIVTRVLAACVDLAIGILGVAMGYAAVVGFVFVVDPRTFSFIDVPFAVLFAALLGLLIIYLALAWATTGRTYGARLLGLRVVNAHGGRVRPGVALLRAALCVLVPLVLFWVVVSPENRSAADILFRTSVVYDWAATATEVPETGAAATGAAAAAPRATTPQAPSPETPSPGTPNPGTPNPGTPSPEAQPGPVAP